MVVLPGVGRRLGFAGLGDGAGAGVDGGRLRGGHGRGEEGWGLGVVGDAGEFGAAPFCGRGWFEGVEHGFDLFGLETERVEQCEGCFAVFEGEGLGHVFAGAFDVIGEVGWQAMTLAEQEQMAFGVGGGRDARVGDVGRA